MSEQTLYFNGLNGSDGNYGLPPMERQEFGRIIRGSRPPEDIHAVTMRVEIESQLKGILDYGDLAQVGWGLVLPQQADPAVQAALQELLDLRREQAGERFYLFAGDSGYRAGESKSKFLERHGMGPGPIDPDKVPYYILLVGDPNEIPFSFQYQLDLQHAVGRLYFEHPQEYARYAQHVALAESGQVQLARRGTLFGVVNQDDPATRLSHDSLVRPLLDSLQQELDDWQFEAFLAKRAGKGQLAQLLTGPDPPAMLFSASHGLEFFPDDPRQIPHQGALLCQEWPGPEQWQGPIPQDFYFAGDDLPNTANLLGLISFHFACYGAGTPRYDEITRRLLRERSSQAEQPFLAALPSRLLRQGALAVVGHVDRAWSYSFHWKQAGAQTRVFENTLKKLLGGAPLGWAMDDFDGRYAELAADLNVLLNRIEWDEPVDTDELVDLWTANYDARGYVILGDPAVRLPLAAPEAQPRPALSESAPLVGMPPGTPPPPPTSSPTPAEEELAFALRRQRSRLGESIQQLTEKLSEALGQAAAEISSLEVRTYRCPDLEGVTFERGRPRGERQLLALTRISFDGDMDVLVPEKEEGIDMDTWQVHRDMVHEAQQNRTQFLTLMAEMAIRLVDLLKP